MASRMLRPSFCRLIPYNTKSIQGHKLIAPFPCLTFTQPQEYITWDSAVEDTAQQCILGKQTYL